MPHRNLYVLDAAEQAARQVNALIDRPKRPPLLHVKQLRDSAQSVVANIAEGFGRGTGRDRDRPLEIARGEAEETIRHLTFGISRCSGFSAVRDRATFGIPRRTPFALLGKRSVTSRMPLESTGRSRTGC
jgi:four helix bundle protein